MANAPLGAFLARGPHLPSRTHQGCSSHQNGPSGVCENKDGPSPIPSPLALQSPIPTLSGICLIYKLGEPLGSEMCPPPSPALGGPPSPLAGTSSFGPSRNNMEPPAGVCPKLVLQWWESRNVCAGRPDLKSLVLQRRN